MLRGAVRRCASFFDGCALSGLHSLRSFQSHQISRYVVNVLVGVFGQQIPMGIAWIPDFDFWRVSVTGKRSRASIVHIKDDDEVVDSIELPFDLLTTL